MTPGSTYESPSQSAARRGLAAAREPRAARPRPEAEVLRSAYLELLKLCLCDLTGASTVSVGRTTEGVVASRTLAGEQLRLRAAGMDWPLQGLTMVGLDRLDDLQCCVESIIHDDVEGDLIEAGTWRGGAAILMRATLDSLGADARTVWVADSFQGFPSPAEDDRDDQWGGIDYLAVPLTDVQANFSRLGFEQGVRYVPGFFADTLPQLAERRWSLIRLDADTYEATGLALCSLYPQLAVGGYLIVDDYGALEECRAAVDDFRRANEIAEPLEQVDWTCVRWRRESEQPLLASSDAQTHKASGARAGATPPPRANNARVPTLDEVDLVHEIAALRRRLADTEAQLERMTATPLSGPREWFHRERDRRRKS